MDAQMGMGWFDQYLLPGLETAAKIALPIIRGGGSKKQYRQAMDAQLGSGWFSKYLLPGLESAAKIVLPMLRGGGFVPHDKHYQSAEGWFSDYLLPGLETAAKIAIPMIRGKGGFFDDFGSLFRGSKDTPYKFGGGWEPLPKKKQNFSKGQGLYL
jgi:hypothetical protein